MEQVLQVSRLSRYPVRVYRGWISIEDQIKTALFDEVSDFAWTVEERGRGIFVEEPFLVKMPFGASSKIARQFFEEAGLVPAYPSLLLSFAALYPDQQRKKRIVGLGEMPTRFIPYLCGNQNKRILAVGKENWIWSQDFHYLLLEKPKN